jgi:hypothetical protein
MLCSSFIDFLNPLRYFSVGAYSSFWAVLFATVLKGLGARIISGACLVLAFWMLTRRENIPGFIVFLFLSLIFAYTGGVLSLFFK